MTKLLTSLTALLIVAAAVAGFFFINQDKALAADAAPIGSDAPGFTLTDVETGKEVSLSDYKGKVVVLLFHSTTCPFYAMDENKGYDRVFVPMVESYKGKDVVFLGINSNKNETSEKIKDYVEKHNINYAVLKDEKNVVADAYGALVASHTMVIDQKGVLRYRGGVEAPPSNPGTCGKSEEQYLAPVIDALLDGKEPPYTETKPKGCGIKRV